MLFTEIIAVCFENHMEHTDALSRQNAGLCNMQFVPRRKHYVSATKPNRLMLLRERVAVYCENHTEHINTLCGQNVQF
jgi:hypothetical protein